MLDYMQQYSGALTFIATIVLAILTAIYVVLTKGILVAAANQSKLSLSPVIGIKITKISIGEVFGPKRRNMSVSLELSNVGNAPAIEVLVDAEMELRYSNVKGEKIIPARFEPDLIPFVRPGESITDVAPGFGNTLITHFFDDVREATRLNIHRIETDPTQESYKTSRLIIIVFYKNSLGQYFKSYYETEIGIWAPLDEEKIPSDDKTAEVNQVYVPRPVFHAGLSDESQMMKEINHRNAKRKLSGW